LDQVLAAVPRWPDENVLIGFDTADDAGVYKLTPELALVQTVDFFTPIVDDPYTYGAIAAANALSDVYAMGGRPISSLSILAWPAKGDVADLKEILRGGGEKMHEANCSILGGHSITDDEIKFGYAVTGAVHPGLVKANSGALPGDALVFTKRLGTGVIATAVKRGIANAAHVDEATASMLALNRRACEEMLRHNAHGTTDVTGFGLLGHAREMAVASGVTLEIAVDAVPFLPGASDYARLGAIPGGLKNNREFISCAVAAEVPIAREIEDLLYDPQTSGGLLIALSESDAAALERSLHGARRIGRVVERQEKPIRLV
jgi:selenide,water dikinase